MTLQQLKYLVAVANSGSINAAAKSLYISQPSLSEVIQNLEQELGFSIFERTSKGIKITQQGMEIIRESNDIVHSFELMEEKYLGSDKSKLIFNVSAQHYTFATEAFMRLVRDLHIPEYDFTFLETTGENVIKNVKEHKSEIGLIYWTDSNYKQVTNILNDNGLSFHKLFSSPQCVMLDENDSLASMKKLNFSDLSNRIYLQFISGEFNSKYFTKEKRTVFDHNKTITCSDRSTLFYLLKKLHAFTICTKMVHKDLNGSNIKVIPLEKTSNVTVGYITLDETLSDFGEKYIKLLKSCSDEYCLL